MGFVYSVQNDPFFEVYSAPDERSAAYMAVGLSTESGEPVIITCTMATSSRNYLPALTEAYYRKIPILAITSTVYPGKVGHMFPQVIDRTTPPQDTVSLSVSMPTVKTPEDEWFCEIQANRVISELFRHGGNPCHINLETTYNLTPATCNPPTRNIRRIVGKKDFPEIKGEKIAIFVGNHIKWAPELIEAVDVFCEKYGAVVLCDHTSNYTGKYKIHHTLVSSQILADLTPLMPDLLIHIGNISGDYSIFNISKKCNVWRVNPDGEIRDVFKKCTFVFEMDECSFFENANEKCNKTKCNSSYFKCWQNALANIRKKIPDVDFSNLWVASILNDKIPPNSVIHFGILNSLRSWNMHELSPDIHGYCNTGGFGIDGCLSTSVGASLSDPKKLFFVVIGDLAFFYDMNVLGNRHLKSNLRILLVNNAKGVEFQNSTHPASAFGSETDKFIAAAGHYGNQSKELIKHYAEDLGFEYLSASTKEDFLMSYQKFINTEITDKPILFEIFTKTKDETSALDKYIRLEQSVASKTKELIKNTLGKNTISILRNLSKK